MVEQSPPVTGGDRNWSGRKGRHTGSDVCRLEYVEGSWEPEEVFTFLSHFFQVREELVTTLDLDIPAPLRKLYSLSLTSHQEKTVFLFLICEELKLQRFIAHLHKAYQWS